MKKVLILSTLMIITGILTGCPDGGGSSSSKKSAGYYGNCTNCGFSQAAFSQSVSSVMPEGVLTLTFIGDSRQMNMWASQQWNPIFSYQGHIMLGGSLNLNSDLYLGMCRLPPGSYTLRTVQAGSYNRGTFNVPAVELIGPVRALVALTEGVILTSGQERITSFGATLRGQSGPSAWGTSYQVYPTYGGFGPQTGCSDTVGVRF